MNSDALEFIDELRAKRAARCGAAPPPRADAAYTVFAVDASGSMEDSDFPPTRYLAGVDAVENFLAMRARLGADDCFSALVFNEDAKVICEAVMLDEIQKRLLRVLRRHVPGGGTDIGAALRAAGDLFLAISQDYGRRLILLSDGHGGRPYDEAEQLKHQGVIIDTIGIGGTPAEVDESCLKTIASMVGGRRRYRFITDKDDLISHFKNIAHDLVEVRT